VPIVLSSLLGTGACPVPPNGTPAIGQYMFLLVRQRPPERRQLRVLEPEPTGMGRAAERQLQPIAIRRHLDVDAVDQRDPAGERRPSIHGSDLRLHRHRHPGCRWEERSELSGVERARYPRGAVARLPDQLGRSRVAGAGGPEPGHDLSAGNIDKYDIIGFASLTIVDVLDTQEAAAHPRRTGPARRTTRTPTSSQGRTRGSSSGRRSGVRRTSCRRPSRSTRSPRSRSTGSSRERTTRSTRTASR
jgi:hypothetical protein